MDVQPATGGPFRTEVDELPLMFSFKPPAIGQVVSLECDPRHQKARFIRSDPAINKKAAEQATKTAYDAERNAGPSAPTAGETGPQS